MHIIAFGASSSSHRLWTSSAMVLPGSLSRTGAEHFLLHLCFSLAYVAHEKTQDSFSLIPNEVR